MFDKLKAIYLNYSFNFPLLIAFLLPFGINYGIIIAFWGICFFMFDDVKFGLKKTIANFWTYLLMSFFVIHLVGYFFSINKQEALSSIEIKLPFLFFSILFFSTQLKIIQLQKIMISFVSGCLILSILCLFRASYLFCINHSNSFFYSDFTYFLHPSYFSMYLIFALLIVMLYYKPWLSHLNYLNIKIGFITCVFLTCIYLSASKMGLITAILILPITLFIILFNQGYKKTIVIVSVSLIAATGLLYQVFPTPFQRLMVSFEVTTSSKNIDTTASESTAVRILIWKQAVHLIQNHVMFGATPGDVKDELCKAYQENGLTGALQKKLNAHNQYLQTFIGTGIIGFILLLLMTLGALIYGFIKKNYLLSLFSVLCILNFLVESMLQAQAGFVFFAFFFCILTQYNLFKLSSNNS